MDKNIQKKAGPFQTLPFLFDNWILIYFLSFLLINGTIPTIPELRSSIVDGSGTGSGPSEIENVALALPNDKGTLGSKAANVPTAVCPLLNPTVMTPPT